MAERGGQPGNTNGVKENRLFTDALRRAIAQDDAKRLRKGIEVLLDMAAEGNLDALEFLADRTDGKPRQQIDMIAEIARRKAADLSDDELAELANAKRSDQA